MPPSLLQWLHPSSPVQLYVNLIAMRPTVRTSAFHTVILDAITDEDDLGVWSVLVAREQAITAGTVTGEVFSGGNVHQGMLVYGFFR